MNLGKNQIQNGSWQTQNILFATKDYQLLILIHKVDNLTADRQLQAKSFPHQIKEHHTTPIWALIITITITNWATVVFLVRVRTNLSRSIVIVVQITTVKCRHNHYLIPSSFIIVTFKKQFSRVIRDPILLYRLELNRKISI